MKIKEKAQSKAQYKLIQHLRSKYGSKDKAPDEHKWVFDKEWTNNVNYDKLPPSKNSKSKKKDDMRQPYESLFKIDEKKLSIGDVVLVKRTTSSTGEQEKGIIKTLNYNVKNVLNTVTVELITGWKAGSHVTVSISDVRIDDPKARQRSKMAQTFRDLKAKGVIKEIPKAYR
jgi:hypothetical protein